jgi:hypothetical protein
VALFLERRNYRFRRMMDAVRVLPVLGFVLWMIPLMWPTAPSPDGGAETGIPMSTALTYVFGVWVALIVLTLVLWRRTQGGAEPGPPTPGAPR